jgi:1,4-dihydroxy-2-naphthoate octaprenyltransferase
MGERTAPRGLALYLSAIRAPFLGASAIPVLVGSTLPFWLRPPNFVFSWARFLETLVAVLFIHVGANLANEYFDYRSGADPANPNRGGLGGGSGLIPDVLPASFFLRGSILSLAIGAALGLHLNAILAGNLVLVLGIAGIFCAFFYTAPPLKLSYRGLGEIVLFTAFGILPVVGAYFVQTESVSWRVVAASLPIAFAVLLILWVNQIADAAPDGAAGKRTLAVALGPQRSARVVVPLLVVLVFASLFAAVFTASLIPLTLVAVLAFGLARTIVAVSWNHYDDPAAFVEVQTSAVKFHLAVGLVIAASALVAMGS